MRISSRRVLVSDTIQPATITIEPPFITAIGAYDGDHGDGDGDDHGDALITPAFINAHTHLALVFLRGFDLRAATRGNLVEDFFYAVESTLTADDIAAFVRMGAYESLLHGVGLVWDHYYAGVEVARAIADTGLAAVVAPTLQDVSGPGKDVWEAQLEATERIDDDDTLSARGVFAALGPHATDTVSASLWDRVVEVACARQLPVHAHLAQSPEEYRRAKRRHGASPVSWLSSLGVFDAVPSGVWAHGIYASQRELRALTSGNNALVWCPYSALVFGFAARPAVWSAIDLPWAVATDCASNNDSMNVQAELRMVAGQRTVGASWSSAYEEVLDGGASSAVKQAWQERQTLHSEHDALAAPRSLLSRVWSVPGRFHPRVRAGVIEAGALANILVWDLDHPALWPALDPLHTLAMSDVPQAISNMYVAGRKVGTIVGSDDYRAAQREAGERLARILDKVSHLG